MRLPSDQAEGALKRYDQLDLSHALLTDQLTELMLISCCFAKKWRTIVRRAVLSGQ